MDISGRWETDFSRGTEDSSKAIGVFKQRKNHLEGTFLTPTGDYRFLEGSVDGKNLTLSCFDGSHAFLFKGEINGNESLIGTFWSGLHWSEPWTARRNESFELPNPDSLTFLKQGYKKLEFSFPDLEGKKVSLADEKFKNKVVIVQIMGSWCPNCMDETVFLSNLYNKKNKKDLEIIGLAFEKIPERAHQNLLRLKDKFKVNYPILLAGPSDKKEAAKALPALNHIMSFPTTIFIDKKGIVRKIHTGFSGPATGSEYDKFKEEFNLFVDKLLKE
jgi:thiol-disulfide isomerase/thioredoxin